MILLDLFLTFLEIGAVSFGGGYGMISLIRELTISKGWLTESELLNFIAVSESTPGPIAINMATFIGSSKAGIPGAVIATLGVVLPSFVIILIIAALLRSLMKYPETKAVLCGVRPAVVGLIISTAVIMLMSNFLSLGKIGDKVTVDFAALGIFFAVAALSFVYKKIFKKKISPILLIIFSAILGAILY